MERITLCNSDLEVSRLCMGGCPLGGHGWGKTDRNELLNTVKEAVEIGINFFDTADVYGRGESEKIIGEALRDKRSKVVIASKFGVILPEIGSADKTYYDNSPAHIKKSIQGTLRRLNTGYVDLYQLHYRDNKTPISLVVETLEKLKQKGYIRYFGLSNLFQKDIEELSQYKNKFATFQNEFSLANRSNEEDIDVISKELDITPMTWGSLGQGILTGKYDRKTVFEKDDRRSRDNYINFHGKRLEKNMDIVDEIKKISTKTGKNLSAIAIRWILDHLENSVVIAGVKNREQLRSNYEGLMWNLNKEDISKLNEISK